MADIFSILSRGTNLKRRREEPATRIVPAVQTTSGSKRANKRKKKTEKTVEDDADIPNELDFFGTASKAVKDDKKLSKDSKEEGGDDDESGSDEELESVDGDEMEDDLPQSSEEDKRRILRENKLKILQIYPLPEEKVEEVKDKKKKKKRKDKDEEPEKKKKNKNKYIPAIVNPLQNFKEMRSRYLLSKRVCENVAERCYPAPTQVQIGSLPLLLDPSTIEPAPPKGNPVNLLVCAPTGSGKTLAFTLPLLSEILKKRKENDGKLPGPYALILAPTKELSAQIVNEIRRFAKGTGIRATLVRKGVDINVVKSHILVGTPGVLVNELKEGAGLPTIKQLILDEADVMLDEMFREQTVAVWNACKLGKGTELRVSLWSATMPSSTETLAKELIIPAEGEKVKKKNVPVIYRLTVGIQASSLPPVHHELTYAATEQGKLLALRQLINSPNGMPTPCLVFTQTIPRATALHSELLYDLPQQGRVHVLHSSLSETQRIQTMDKFRQGEIWLLITTDLLSRGVDFAGVKLVINYDIPTSVASFIHRVGRTARGGATGKAVTFYTKEDIPYVRGIVGVVDRAEGGHDWLMAALPKVGKREKQKLKKHGVDARKDIKITTKSMWERRKEERRKGAKEGSKRRKELEDAQSDSGSDDDGADNHAADGGDSDGSE